MKDKFELLRVKDIISILDGDTSFDEFNGVDVKMPYLSGPDLCKLSTRYGLPATYSMSGGALSRWEYMGNLIKHCIDNNRLSLLLSELFSIKNFQQMLKGLSIDLIEYTHDHIIRMIYEEINAILLFGGNMLDIVGNKFVIREIGSSVEVEAPTVKTIDLNYIKSLADRANLDIKDNNCDSAITKARTILEETFCYVIEKKNGTPNETGNINKLYSQVKDLYNMHANKDLDKRVNMLLSGLEKIISSISEMRNKSSDSHGIGSKRISISDYHARLFVNSAVMMAEFILSVYKNQ